MRALIALVCGLAAMCPTAALAATGDPPANRTLSQTTLQACHADPAGQPCQAAALADLNAARAAEGVGPMQLPGDFASLTIPQQLLVLSNLERVDRGLAPVIGLSGPLDQDAQTAAQQHQDPQPTNFYGDTWTANWEGGYVSPFESDFAWMYDDGLGSGNIDCTPFHQTGCWGHRHDILWPLDSPAVMGAGQSGASEAELFVGGDTQTAPGRPDAPLDPTWAAIAATLPFSVSPASLSFAPSQSSATVTVAVSGESMAIAAALSAGAAGWSVTPSTCAVTAGSSCTLTVSAAPAAGGTAAVLTLQGPNGAQTVALAKQGAASLHASASHATITAGASATVTGTLLRPAGAGAPGQVVTLTQKPAGARAASPVANATTSARGTVSFRVKPRVNTTYVLVFAGNPTLSAASGSPVQIRVAPRITAALAHRTVARGQAARVSGRVTPAPGRRRLALQFERGRRWVTIVSVRADRAGRYNFRIRPHGAGLVAYRVRLPATATHAAGVSRVLRLRTS